MHGTFSEHELTVSDENKPWKAQVYLKSDTVLSNLIVTKCPSHSERKQSWGGAELGGGGSQQQRA